MIPFFLSYVDCRKFSRKRQLVDAVNLIEVCGVSIAQWRYTGRQAQSYPFAFSVTCVHLVATGCGPIKNLWPTEDLLLAASWTYIMMQFWKEFSNWRKLIRARIDFRDVVVPCMNLILLVT